MKRFQSRACPLPLTLVAACVSMIGWTHASADEMVAAYLPQNAPAAAGVSSSTNGVESEGLASRLLSRTSLSWTGQLNGPSLGKGSDTNYNTFQNSYGPLYIYHTADLLHFFGRASHVGLEVSAKQDFGHAIKFETVGPYGPYEQEVVPARTINDPQLWYRSNGLFEGQWLGLDGAFNLWPAVTDYSREIEHLAFAFALDSNIRFKLPSYRWRASVNTRLRPSVYTSGSDWSHEQLFLSAGHSLGYRLSDAFDLVNTTQFDFNYYKDPSGSFIRGNSNDDKAQLQLNYYHSSGIARVGAYVQSLIFDPQLATATVGMELTINFLRGH